jgi:uncharacterized membrane-anchored protein
MRRKWLFFCGAMVLQLLLLVAVIVPRISILANGKTVFIETLPYDPYNVLSGYYVDLNYRISEPENLPAKKTYQEHRDYYIVLEPRHSAWQPVAVYERLPQYMQAGRAVIRGRYRYGVLDYGIGRYYLPEAQRERIETSLRETVKAALVEIKVNRKGDAALVGIIVGNERFEY